MAQIQVTNLTFSYDGSSDTIFDKMSFTLDTDWKLGLIGRNGKGKTTFLNLLLADTSIWEPFVHRPYLIIFLIRYRGHGRRNAAKCCWSA